MGRVSAGNGANPVSVTVGNGNANGNISSNTVTPSNTDGRRIGDWTKYLFNFNVPSNGTLHADIPGDRYRTAQRQITRPSLTTFPSLPVAIPPAFTSQPTPEEMIYVGGTAHFSAQATGSPAPTEQWQIESNGAFVTLNNSGRISGATNTTLTISGLVPGDATNYLLQASNTGGSANSAVDAIGGVACAGGRQL